MTACFSYRDINKVLFITALIIDVDNGGNPILYAEAFKGVRGGTPEGMDERILFNGTGKTLFEAVRDMNATSSFKLNYTQNKVIIFTEKAAEYGIDNYIDFLDRDQELLIRPYIAVYRGDPQKLMKLHLNQEKYIGVFVVELIENIGSSSRAIEQSLNQFYNQRVMGDRSSVVTILDIPKNSLEPKLEINGGAVIKNDRMIGTLSRSEGQGFNFLMNSIKGGTLEITNPCDVNRFVTLEILKNKTKTKVDYYENIVHFKKNIKVDVDFGEAQKSIVLTKENIEKIQEKAESNIKKACIQVFQQYKDIGVDIFDICEVFHAKYPKAKFEDIINQTQLEVEVEVKIMNTGDTKNFN